MGDTAQVPFAAILDSRTVLNVAGPEAHAFLQGLVTNDMNKVIPERAVYAALLTPQGKFLFDFFIVRHEGGFWLDCEAARADALAKRLSMYKLRADVTVNAGDGPAVAVMAGSPPPGAAADAGPGTAWPIADGVAFVDPRLAELGFRLMAPRAALEAVIAQAGVAVGDEAAYDRHRLALGVPQGGIDIEPDKSFLLESNFDELHGVDFRKGCYVGQELTARTKHRGKIRKRLIPVNVSGPVPDPGTPVTAGEVTLGEVRSGRDGRALALIRLDRYRAAREAGQELKGGRATLEVDWPHWLNAEESRGA